MVAMKQAACNRRMLSLPVCVFCTVVSMSFILHPCNNTHRYLSPRILTLTMAGQIIPITTTMAEDRPRWLPLESNPEVMNKFVANIGLDTTKHQFVDVYGLDEALLQMVPRPVLGVLLLFPVGDSYVEQREAEAAKIDEEGQVVSDKVFSMSQTISNACGTVGLIHCIGNNLDKVTLTPDSYLDKYFSGCEDKSREEAGQMLETAEGISGEHEESAAEGQTEAPELEDSVDLHFVCFIERDGHLYELDGNKKYPINHGESSPDTILEDTAKVVKKFMDRTPDDLRFTLVALSATS
eukprot:m.95226 g.95226  ORF g.95226 m.95226 type:complete len:295 (-) comp13049_c0_seq1:107-991(-)